MKGSRCQLPSRLGEPMRDPFIITRGRTANFMYGPDVRRDDFALEIYLIFKDERKEPLKKFIRIASGPSLEVPGAGSASRSGNRGREGPSAMKIGSQYLAYYDHIAIRSGDGGCAFEGFEGSPAEVTVSGRQQTRGFFEDYERGSGTAEEVIRNSCVVRRRACRIEKLFHKRGRVAQLAEQPTLNQ